jgi:protein SCO1/2
MRHTTAITPPPQSSAAGIFSGFFFVRYLLVVLLVGLSACADSTGRPAAGDFVLQSATGPVDTRALRGKVLLLYFGYVNCPDVCPPSMAAGAAALNALKPEERARVRMIMVSVDPERDTLAALKEYAAYFHPEMIGATGTVAEIAAVAKAYNAGYVRQPTRPDGSYAIDHTSHTYVIDREGKLAEVIPLGMAADKMAGAVRKLL